jgi:hypothetical protein
MLLEELVHPGFVGTGVYQVLENLHIMSQPFAISLDRDPTCVSSTIRRCVIVFAFDVGANPSVKKNRERNIENKGT